LAGSIYSTVHVWLPTLELLCTIITVIYGNLDRMEFES
jgi:hypothetical protein